MYINRLLLLIAGVTLIFLPAIQDWVLGSGTAWYRPHIIWLFIVLAAYLNQRSGYPDEL